MDNYLFNGQPVKKLFQDFSGYSMRIYIVSSMVQKNKAAHFYLHTVCRSSLTQIIFCILFIKKPCCFVKSYFKVITLAHSSLCSLVAAGLFFPVLPCLCLTTSFIESLCGLCISFLKRTLHFPTKYLCFQ